MGAVQAKVVMRNGAPLVLACLGLAAWGIAPASAKISAMSGAYDGRGKPPEVVKPGPKTTKTRVRRGRALKK